MECEVICYRTSNEYKANVFHKMDHVLNLKKPTKFSN